MFGHRDGDAHDGLCKLNLFMSEFIFCFLFLKFFAVHWVENGNAAKQAIEVWENVKVVIKW